MCVCVFYLQALIHAIFLSTSPTLPALPSQALSCLSFWHPLVHMLLPLRSFPDPWIRVSPFPLHAYKPVFSLECVSHFVVIPYHVSHAGLKAFMSVGHISLVPHLHA